MQPGDAGGLGRHGRGDPPDVLDVGPAARLGLPAVGGLGDAHRPRRRHARGRAIRRHAPPREDGCRTGCTQRLLHSERTTTRLRGSRRRRPRSMGGGGVHPGDPPPPWGPGRRYLRRATRRDVRRATLRDPNMRASFRGGVGQDGPGAVSRSVQLRGLLGRQQPDLDQVQRADEPVADAEAARAGYRVPERDGPVVLDQQQGGGAPVRDLLDDVPRVLLGERRDTRRPRPRPRPPRPPPCLPRPRSRARSGLRPCCRARSPRPASGWTGAWPRSRRMASL